MTDHDKVHLLRMRFVTNEVCNAAADEIEQLREKLAAAQAREQQLKSALLIEALHWRTRMTKAEIKEEIDERFQSDTSALEALIAKAGEVMRGRCAVEAYEWAMAYVVEDTAPVGNAEAIRALPGVTLEDLQK